MTVVLLSTWIPSLRTLASQGQAAECYFMDGPYHFTVSAMTGGEWRISCFERREGPSVANAVAEWPTIPDQFLGSAGVDFDCDREKEQNKFRILDLGIRISSGRVRNSEPSLFCNVCLPINRTPHALASWSITFSLTRSC